MTEGLFWIICSMNDSDIDWNESWELCPLFAKSYSISHKDAWAQLAKSSDKRFRQFEYNHYPRGRVVVRNDEATIFLNQHIANDDVISAVIKTFRLTTPRIHAEGGEHYKCYIDL